MARPKEGDEIGPWLLLEPIGSGANADVWRVTNSSGEQAALKVLKSVNPNSEPYRRFRQEITSLQELKDVPGILPVIASNLPPSPSRRNPGWLAMPIAIPIRKALGNATLDEIVEAVASIAQALALLAERRVFHRDLKPENLYRHNEGWAVGDFGLVEFPNKEALTEENRKLGPIGYLAPEMLANAASAEPGPADVYSLAKTFWVLASGQNYPLQGELRMDRAGARISDVVAHERSHFLDRLLERATSDAVVARPSMTEIASELRAWLSKLPVSPPQPDLTDLATRVASTLGPGLLEQRRRQEYGQLAHDQFQELHGGMQRLEGVLNTVGLPGQLTTRGDRIVLKGFLLRSSVTTAGGEQLQARLHSTLRVRTLEGTTLWSEVALELFDDGTIDLAGGHLIGTSDQSIVGKFEITRVLWHSNKTGLVGSAEQASAASQLLLDMETKFPAAVEAFLAHVKGE